MANQNQPGTPPAGQQPASQPGSQQPAQQQQPAAPTTQPAAQPAQQQQPAAPAAQPAAQSAQQQTAQQPQPGQPSTQQPAGQKTGAPPPPVRVPGRPGVRGVPQKPGGRKPPSPKKLLYGCAGCSSIALLFFIIFVLVFVGQTTPAGENALARSLGVSTGAFINTLISLVHLIFGAISVFLFLLAIIGLFRFFMARKDDKESRKKGFTLAGISGLLLLIFIAMWVGIYLFMSSKRVAETAQVSGIVTEPAETLQLTGPINITFDGSNVPINRSRYEILSYLWDFGDGDTSTTVLTSHTYDQIGRFDVQLQVSKRDITNNEESVDTFTRTVTIANIALSAVFTADPLTGPAPLEVAFDAGDSAAPAGEITAYEWDFDDDNVFTDAEGVTVTHEFTQVGTYKVNLRVTDNVGNFEVTSKDIIVEGENIPTAVIEIPTEDGNYYVGRQYSFQGEKSTSPNGRITGYEWDFGDGSPKANTRTATHIYKTEGEYEVILVVEDETGEEGEGSKKIEVETQEAAPIAVISTVPAPEGDNDFIGNSVPFEVSFSGGDSTDADNNIVDYNWDFDGDGSVDASGENVTYVYKEAGIFNATLTVIDAEDNEANAIIVVRVGEQPLTARLTATPIEGVAPLTVTFDASSSSYPAGEIVSYEWDFGDGSPKRIDVSQVTYKYEKIGTFTAEVTAIASDNSRSTAELNVNVRPVPLTACFEALPETGPAPLSVEFDPRCSTGTIASYSWNFGDGQSSKTRKPTHDYQTPGSYTVTLEVADNQNVLDTFTKTILVTGTI